MTRYTAAYLQGQQAYREGRTLDDNPYYGETSRAGIRRFADEAAWLEWARGYGTAREAAYLAKHGPLPQLGDFVRRKSRRH